MNRRIYHVRHQLKTDLIVSSSRRPVGQYRDPSRGQFPEDTPRGYVARDSGRIPVSPLVAGPGDEQGNGFFDQLPLQVYHDGLFSATGQHSFFHIGDLCLVGLSDVCRYRDHGHALIRQPPADGAAVQAAGRGQCDRLPFQFVNRHAGHSSQMSFRMS